MIILAKRAFVLKGDEGRWVILGLEASGRLSAAARVWLKIG